MTGRNYINPNDRGRFGFSESGEFKAQRRHAAVISVTEEVAYAQLVLGRVERTLARETIFITQPLERSRPPAGRAIVLPGQRDVVAARLEHGDRKSVV